MAAANSDSPADFSGPRAAGRLDGLPARFRRSLGIGADMVVALGRKRATRDPLKEEEVDALALNAAGELKTESPRPVESILEDILTELRTHTEILLNQK